METKAELALKRRAARELKRLRMPFVETVTRLEAFALSEGLVFEERNPGCPEYQIARLIGKGVRLVVYPHRTTNGSVYPRIRDENSADKTTAAAIMEKTGLHVKSGGLGQ